MKTRKLQINDAKKFSDLPKKIIQFKDHEALSECLLYEILNDSCLQLKSISYFVYNPDFDICKGIAGASKKDLSKWKNDPWSEMNEFSIVMKNSEFNKKIISTEINMSHKEPIESIVEKLRISFENQKVKSHFWQHSNGNYGILLYISDKESKIESEEIDNAAGILSFCPIG